MQPMVNIALRAARNAAEQITRAVERLDLIKSEQSSVAEFLTDTCVQAEKTVAQAIQKAYPGHTVIGEYTGRHEALNADEATPLTWHVNPVDSISNFANGLPLFALSIAGLNKDARIEHAVVINPIAGEEFTASRGRGAQLNGKRLRVSNMKQIAGSLIGTGFFNRTSDKPYLNDYQEFFKNVTLAGGQVYNGGSPALSLAYTAAGRLDAFCQIGLSQWEMEAGALLLQEAGGLIGDFNGNTDFRSKGNIVAGSPKMFKTVLQTLRPRVSDNQA